jgi:hypothetical protein
MSELIKRKYNIGIGRETSRGVVIAPKYWLKPLSQDYDDKIEIATSERACGVIEDSEDMVIKKKFSTGKIDGEIFDKSFGLFLLASLGQVASAEKQTDSGVFDHTFSVLQSAKHPTLTLEVKRGDNEQKAYPNCVVESLKIEAQANEYVKFEAQVRGKSGVNSNSIPGYETESYFLGKDVLVKLADNLAGLGSATAIDARKVEVHVAKNIEEDKRLGSIEPNDFLNKEFSVEGTIEVLFKDTVLKNWALNGDQKALRIEIADTTKIIGTASHPNLKIDLAKIKFKDPVESGDNNEIVKVAVGFKGLYSATDGKSIEVVLTNLEVNY